jgi:hypothetical protein
MLGLSLWYSEQVNQPRLSGAQLETVMLSIQFRRFEFTVDGLSLFIQLGRWEAYWNALDMSLSKRRSGWTFGERV